MVQFCECVNEHLCVCVCVCCGAIYSPKKYPEKILKNVPIMRWSVLVGVHAAVPHAAQCQNPN